MVVMLLGQSRVFFSMSKDGLLPKWASKIHPRFRTPYISTILVGLCVATVAALTPIDVLGRNGFHRHLPGVHHRLRRRLGLALAAIQMCRARS